MKLLLTSIDDVEMRRLKEGFYTIMKLANAVKDKGPAAKQEMIEFSRDNKLDKPATEQVLFFKTSLEEPPPQVAGPAKAKKKKGAPMMRKRPMLKLGAGEASDEEKPTENLVPTRLEEIKAVEPPSKELPPEVPLARR